MDVSTLEKIKSAAQAALTGRRRLDKLHATYCDRVNTGRRTRATTTTYNANTASIMENIVRPNESFLKEVLR